MRLSRSELLIATILKSSIRMTETSNDQISYLSRLIGVRIGKSISCISCSQLFFEYVLVGYNNTKQQMFENENQPNRLQQQRTIKVNEMKIAPSFNQRTIQRQIKLLEYQRRTLPCLIVITSLRVSSRRICVNFIYSRAK